MTSTQAISPEGRLAQIKRELDEIGLRASELRRERNLLMAAVEGGNCRSRAAKERYETAKKLKAEGMTYAAVGRQIGCSGQRVKQILSHGDRRAEMSALVMDNPIGEISVRTENCLKNHYGEITPEVILRAATELDALLATPNFGKRSAREVAFLADCITRTRATGAA